MKRLLVVAVTSAFFLSGCAAQANVSANESPASISPTPVESVIPNLGDSVTGDPNTNSGATPSDGKGDPLGRTAVLWNDYPAGTQTDIDVETAAADCKSLDSQHGSAIANEEAVRATSGHGAQALLAYIDEALKIAACS